MIMSEKAFLDWYSSDAPTDEERELVEKVGEYEEFFQDMLFEPGTSSYEMIKCLSKKVGLDVWEDDEATRPDELRYFSPYFLKFKVEDLGDTLAYYDHEEGLICVSPEGLRDPSTILHEMIHIHENLIDEMPLYFHDMLYWALYKDLRGKIPILDEIITNHAHVLVGSSIYQQGGLHGILFLLKSFDLDIRMGYSLGTVFGYGKLDEFKDYEYHTQR